jgi:lipoprotein-anchoring transpeptidase ErfK/SrfK
MRHLLFVLVFACMGAEGARADLVIAVDKSQQRMLISVDGQDRYNWPISTARAGYSTPNGVYHPEHLARRWFSRQYYGSPMPHAIFFHGGFAIHGSHEISRLGGPASHGCVRLHPEHAAALFALVQEEGLANTEIVITGPNPPVRHAAHARRFFNFYPGYFRRGGFFGRI